MLIDDMLGGIEMNKPKLYTMPVSTVYPLYIAKAEKKGRTKEEVDAIIYWFTGHDAVSFEKVLENEIDFETFFNNAPMFHENAQLITGVICGIRVEEIEDEIMWKVRCLDKLIDELAKGKAMEKILRS